MKNIYVQFSDSTETRIVSTFGCPQDLGYYPNQGKVDETDSRYLSFLSPPPAEYVSLSVSRRQGRLALNELDMLAKVEAFIAGIEDPKQRMDAQIEYEADTWEIENPFLQEAWTMLPDPKPSLADMFVLANIK